jgi:hypothetical protein
VIHSSNSLAITSQQRQEQSLLTLNWPMTSMQYGPYKECYNIEVDVTWLVVIPKIQPPPVEKQHQKWQETLLAVELNTPAPYSRHLKEWIQQLSSYSGRNWKGPKPSSDKIPSIQLCYLDLYVLIQSHAQHHPSQVLFVDCILMTPHKTQTNSLFIHGLVIDKR